MHLSQMRPFVAQPFAPASHGRSFSGRPPSNWAERVPAISERDGNFSRGSRNPRNTSDDGRVSAIGDGAGGANDLFSQIINWELGSADDGVPVAGRSFSGTRAAQRDQAEPTIYDLLALVAPPLT